MASEAEVKTENDWFPPEFVAALKDGAAVESAKPRTEGWVYFIGGATGCIKIGWTAGEPKRRLAALQTGSPIPLYVLAKVRGDPAQERAYHEHFRSVWSHGEWFERTSYLLKLINELAEANSADRVKRGLTA